MRTKNETVKDDKHRMDGTRVVHKAVASRDDRWFDRINTAFLIGVVLVIGYPLWFVLIASISDPQAVESGKVWIWPVDFTIDGYLRVFAENSIWIGYRNTIEIGEHTSELQSRGHLVCRLLLEKQNIRN